LKLWALDLDGTLLQRDGTIAAGDRAAVEAARCRGERVVLATGRAFAGASAVARELGLHGPIIVTTGGQIVDLDSETAIDERRLDRAVARDVLAFCRAHRHAAGAFADLGRDVRWVVAPPQWRRLPVIDPTLPESLQQDPEQLVLLGEQAVRAVMGAFPHIHLLPLPNARQPVAAHVLHPEATKGLALLRLAGRLGLSAADVAAVGDSANDISMLKAAGRGFAMAGSPPEVAAAADAIVASVAEAMATG
jgi:hydroxymethylpyrimidine pyrophosphatase-like HAD family hydrolase